MTEVLYVFVLGFGLGVAGYRVFAIGAELFQIMREEDA